MKQIIVAFLFLFSSPAFSSEREKDANICANGERVVFSCKVEGNKYISICASPTFSENGAHMQYKFGRLVDQPELTFPKVNEPPKANFRSGHIQYTSASLDMISFTIPPIRYTVFDARGKGVYEAGVVVKKAGLVLATKHCQGYSRASQLGSNLHQELLDAGALEVTEEPDELGIP